MMQMRCLAAGLFVWLLISTAADAQVLVHPVFNALDSGTYNLLTLDSQGPHCTAGGTFEPATFDPNIDNRINHIVFARSDDRGKTWQVQDPHLPRFFEARKLQDIQQIDSLNVVAVGDSGLILRTTDAGATWMDQSISFDSGYTHGRSLTDVDFLDSSHGVAVGLPLAIVTTSDAGVTWKVHPKTWLGAMSCKMESDRIRVYQWNGRIFTTRNQGETWDSSATSELHLQSDSNLFSTPHAAFFGDTVIAYGFHYRGVPIPPPSGYMVMSTDDGGSWRDIFDDPRSNIVWSMSHRFANHIIGGQNGLFVPYSHDGGETWTLDTVVCSNGRQESLTYYQGWPNGDFIALAYLPFPGSTVIYSGNILGNNHVELNDLYFRQSYVYPNPASSSVTIKSIGRGSEVRIVDLLGRTVRSGMIDSGGSLQFLVSDLPMGAYQVLLVLPTTCVRLTTLVVLR